MALYIIYTTITRSMKQSLTVPHYTGRSLVLSWSLWVMGYFWVSRVFHSDGADQEKICLIPAVFGLPAEHYWSTSRLTIRRKATPKNRLQQFPISISSYRELSIRNCSCSCCILQTNRVSSISYWCMNDISPDKVMLPKYISLAVILSCLCMHIPQVILRSSR